MSDHQACHCAVDEHDPLPHHCICGRHWPCVYIDGECDICGYPKHEGNCSYYNTGKLLVDDNR